MLAVCLYGCYEGLFGALHEVASATAVHVDVDAAGEHVGALGVDDLVGLGDAVVVVEDSLDARVLDEYAAAFKPTVRGEDAAVDNLNYHG